MNVLLSLLVYVWLLYKYIDSMFFFLLLLLLRVFAEYTSQPGRKRRNRGRVKEKSGQKGSARERKCVFASVEKSKNINQESSLTGLSAVFSIEMKVAYIEIERTRRG